MKNKFFKNLIIFVLLCSVTLGFCSCGTEETAKYSNSFLDCFDTVISVSAYCKNQAEFDELFKLVHEKYLYYHQLFDIYNDYEGVVNAKSINDKATTQAVCVDEPLYNLILLGKDMYSETGGSINIAFGSVLKIWHNAREYALKAGNTPYVPELAELKNAALHCNIDNIVIDDTERSVYLADPEMSIDLGACAKGYATELVAEYLESIGKSNIIISAGGNVRSVGLKPDGSNWVIAVTNPDKSSQDVPEYLSVNNCSVVTSGSYERYYEIDGVRYHHIINKDSLMPENYYTSVTVICEDSAIADCLSTAIFNMQLEDGLQFVNSLENTYVMWITSNNEKVYSEGFEKYILGK